MPEKTFEQAMQRLEQLTRGLEQGDLPLEKAIKAFEEGMQLVNFCSAKLEEAEKRVTLLIEKSSGALERVPFEEQENDQ